MSVYDDEEAMYSKIPVERDILDEEKEVAEEIFNAYCAFRKSKGLPVPAWDPDMAGLAFVAAVRVSKLGELKHRTAFTTEQMKRYSDILQYSTWRMSGNEAVQRWSTSDGHRKMMQCRSTEKVGVAAYKSSGGVWYYVVVYDFIRVNQGGN